MKHTITNCYCDVCGKQIKKSTSIYAGCNYEYDNVPHWCGIVYMCLYFGKGKAHKQVDMCEECAEEISKVIRNLHSHRKEQQ